MDMIWLWVAGGGSFSLVGMMGFAYFLFKTDSDNWTILMRRISRNIRSRVENGKAVKALEVKTKDVEKAIEDDWVAQFEGRDDVKHLSKEEADWEKAFPGIRYPHNGTIKPLTKTGKLTDLEGCTKPKKHFIIMVINGKREKIEIDHPELKHEIVKKYYYKSSAYNELWPAYICKCGDDQSNPTIGSNGMATAQRKLDKLADDHVRSQNKAEELLKRNGGKFAW